MTVIARQLRKEATVGESLLWTQLRNRQMVGRKFRRQQPIGAFVVDFYCDEVGLVVEVDGPGHADQRDADQHRDDVLSELGLHIIRVSADCVEDDMPRALHEIELAVHELATFPLPLGEGLG
jgi:very-short-patch-repair endonuclease